MQWWVAARCDANGQYSSGSWTKAYFLLKNSTGPPVGMHGWISNITIRAGDNLQAPSDYRVQIECIAMHYRRLKYLLAA